MKKLKSVFVICVLSIMAMALFAGCESKESKEFKAYHNEDMKETRALFSEASTEMETVTSKDSTYEEYETVFPSCLTKYNTCLDTITAYQSENNDIKAINELYKLAIQARITYIETTLAEIAEGAELDTEPLFNASNDAVIAYNDAAIAYAKEVGLTLEEE